MTAHGRVTVQCADKAVPFPARRGPVAPGCGVGGRVAFQHVHEAIAQLA